MRDPRVLQTKGTGTYTLPDICLLCGRNNAGSIAQNLPFQRLTHAQGLTIGTQLVRKSRACLNAARLTRENWGESLRRAERPSLWRSIKGGEKILRFNHS